MLGGVHTDLLVTVALLFLTQTETQCRAENDFSLVTLPEWRTNSEYVTRCFYDRHNNVICDWMRNQQNSSATEDVAVKILESGPLGLEGEACLEFWYLAPVAAEGSELLALLKSSVGEVQIWTSPALPRDSWRQVFVPLNITEPGTQVVFKAAVSMEGQVEVNRIGVRKGSCGQQCENNTELWTDRSTRCLCSGGQLSCSSSQCPKGQICGPQRKGISGIYPYGTCSIHSSKDSSTFDGVLFHFMTSCTYILARKCSLIEALPMFSVEVVSEPDWNSSVPTIQQVNVEIGIFRVSLMKSQTQRVVVNGIWRTLPLKLSSSTIDIVSNPASVTLGTSFGLSISYDNAGAVHLNLPSTYSDHVCGLCGNFNHFKGDDFRAPNGTNAQDAAAVAGSWHTGQTTSSCETVLVPHQCDPVEEAKYASELYCGGLFSTTGPFADCLSVLEVEHYFRDCVVDMCSTDGDPAALCETLTAYAETCQEAGVTIPTWRNSTLCPIQCSENSHYNSCANGCPEVCSSLDVVSPCRSCEERCECDYGYKLSGGKCVPAEDCGCWYNGKHYERGETVLEGTCVEQCQCMGNNEMQCNTMQCARNEVCKVKDGVKGCFPFNPSTCSVYGDPHYITFDGMAYDFQGGCKYTLTTACGGDSTVPFTVIGHNMHPPLQSHTRSKLEAVSLQVEDLNLTLNQSREVYVNHVSVQLPYSTNGTYGTIWVDMKDNYIILESTFGLRMIIDGQTRLFLQVDERYKYELCGLCGTYSDQQDDDFITPEGQNVTKPFEFGDSWRLLDDNECTAHPDDPRLCDYDEENNAYNQCYALLGDAFKPCHELLHPSIYLTSCVYDYCATSGDQHTLCESLTSYATACQVAGVELPNWQTDTACDNPTTTTTLSPTSPTPDQISCPIDCTFENSLCGWEQLTEDSFDWTRNSGQTPSDLTGPDQDHTTGAGFYMYIDGRNVTHGNTARLLSATCHYNGSLCLHFWYHMYGSATAMTLNIYLLKNNKVTKLWSMMNNQGLNWHPVYLDITESGPFQIIAEGIRGSNNQSDVAIDDISIAFGSCSGRLHRLVSETETPAEIHPSHPVCNLNCSFDSNLCSWNQMITDAFNWTWQSGSTPTLMTGPSADHTGAGHYLYIEASNVTHGDTAHLISSDCSDPGPQCLQFWYHMYGSADTMGLNVYLLQNKLAEAVWSKRNNQGNRWQLAQVDFTTTGAFQIIFEGRRGSNDQSDVAIDDVSLNRGHCTDLTKPTIPTTTISSTTTQPQIPTSLKPHPPSALTTTTTRISATTDRTAISTTTPATTVTPKPSNPDVPTRPQLLVTSRPITTTTTTGPQTTRPHPPTTEHAVVETSEQPKLEITERPQKAASQEQAATTTSPKPPTTAKPQPTTTAQTPTTARPRPSITAKPKPHKTVGPNPPITAKTQPQTTGRPNPPTSAKPQPQTTSRPRPPKTAKPQPTTGRPNPATTAKPQPPTTARPNPATRTKPQPPTTARQNPLTTAKPQPPTTARSQPTTTAKSQPPTTARPRPPITAKPQLPTTARPNHPTTVKPQPSTTTKPQPPTTARPQPPITAKPQSPTTARPQPPTTAKPQSPTTARPQPTTTAMPQPAPTARPRPPITAKPQLPTTARPNHPTTAKPQPSTTAKPQPPTTARPQPPITAKPQSPTTARPQPPTTAKPQSPTTARTQPTTTAMPQPAPTARPRPPIIAKPQLPTTARPNHPTTAKPQPSTTTKPQPPTTARPQPPITAKPQSPTTARPQTTAKPQPSTTAGLQPPTERLPQPQTTVKSRPQTTSQTELQTTARPQLGATTTQKPPGTARPQSPTTIRPQPPTTAKPHPPTTDLPKPPATVKPQLTTATPKPTTALRPQSTTPAGPESPTTAEPQLPTTARPRPPTESQPQSQTTTTKKSPATARPQPLTTTGQQPQTETPPQQQTTLKPHPTTDRPQPITSATSQSTTTARPQPSTTPVPTPSCPQNSHYTTCIPACNPTCTHVNGPPNCSENERCVQGCVCNDGFVQKRNVCVPIQQCGCLDRNGDIHQFNEVWYTNHCSQKCECEKHHGVGEIDCDDKDECNGNAVCLQNEEGDYYCQSTGFNECTIKKDHEYRTFDKMKYDFEGEHSYVLVQTRNLPNNLPDLCIVGNNAHTVNDDDDSPHHGDSSSEEDHRDEDDDHDEDYEDDDDKHEDDSEEHEERQGLQELKIRVYNHTVEFKKKQRLVVDGRRTNTPVSPTAGLKIYKRFSHIYLKTDFGLLVKFNGRSSAEIVLPRIYKTKVGGLCGNFDGQKRNDWMRPDGSRLTSVQEFGESWRE